MNDLGVNCRDMTRVTAGLCHLFGVVPLYGPVFSGIVWLAVQKRNPLLAFQALQAFAAQILFLLAFLIPAVGILVGYLFHWLNAPFAEVVFTMNVFFTRLLLVASWIIFPYAAFRVIETGRFVYPVVGPIARIRQGLVTEEAAEEQ